MSKKAVFLDRDNTLMQDPGYLSDPEGVRLLPGVELAVKSLAKAGFKLVVVTNQSGVARGLLTEETLEKVHAELRRQLAEQNAHLDAIYYCPYHPEGVVEQYAVESDLRKPKPGMLRRAADEMDIDVEASWMVGDSSCDIEAGQRAGCRTIRVRRPGEPGKAGKAVKDDEDAQADFTVRNLVDAARVILREGMRTPADVAEAGGPEPAATVAPQVEPARPATPTTPTAFSPMRFVGMLAQVLAVAALIVAVVMAFVAPVARAQLWATLAVTFQVAALTFLTLGRNEGP